MADQRNPTGNDPTSYERLVFSPVSSGQAATHPLPPGLRRGDRVIDEIENTADYYGPDLYRNLLTFFSSSEFQFDSNQDFIPVSQTKANPKLFVVGIIPPAAKITGRMLDRSASIASVTGWPEQQLDYGDQSGNYVGGEGAKSTGVSDNGVTLVDSNAYPRGAALEPSFWVSYVQMCQRLKVDPYEMAAVWECESNFSPAAQNKQGGRVIAQGFNQLTLGPAKKIGMSDEVWNNFATLSPEQQLPWSEKYFRGAYVKGKKAGQIYRVNFGGYTNPDGSIYASKAYINSLPEADRAKFKNPDYQEKVCKQNPGLVDEQGRIMPSILDKNVAGRPSPGVRDSIQRAMTTVGSSKPPDFVDPATSPPPKDTGNGSWVDGGNTSAAQSKRESEAKVDTDLNRSTLGARFQGQQRAEAKLTKSILDMMGSTPPLRLLVNPKSFKVSSEKVVSDGNWTRNGPIVEHWGDQQDKIDASGTLAAFFAIDANSQTQYRDGSSPGLTRVARNYSESYRNFLSLFLLYKNNGYCFTAPLEQETNRDKFFARLSLVGSIYIYYDSILYIGSFDNFNITETDDKPYTLEYNFQFTVRATFVLDRPDDYGGRALPQRSRPVAGISTDQILANLEQSNFDEQSRIRQAELESSETDIERSGREADEAARTVDFFKNRPPSGDITLDPSVLAALKPPSSQGQVVPKPTQAQRKGKK